MDESNRFSAFIEALRARTAASVATSQDLYTYYQYNSAGQLILKASPSAVTGYSEEDPDLVGWSGDTATFLNSGSGLITTYEYGASTTAESDTAGDVTGYLKDVSIQEGTGGTPVPQDDYTYFSNTVSGVSIYPVASTTQYRNSDGTGAETTSYAYTFFSDTNAIQSITTTLPTVTTGENGPDSATSTTTFLDQYGRPIWEKNQDGYINYTQYDDATGAVTEQIQDVKTCITGDYSDLPEGWSTIDGAGLNLVTTYVVDSLGRTTEVTSPSGMVTYTVYLDGSNEVRTYSGWNSTTHAPTGPTTVTIDDWADGYVETLTMTVAPYLSSGAPDGLEPISDVQSLTRNYETPGGVVTETDDYFNLGGLTYTSGTLGTSGVNYYATLYGYDEDGNLNRTLSPQGTIYRTVFNDQHQPISKWVGTNDTVSLGAWSPSNMGSGNMVETEAYVYNNDGDLTQTTQSPGGMATNSVTDYWYDWRDQEVAEQQGVEMSELDSVNRPLTVYTYNNLNEVIETQVYNGSGVTLTIVSGELSLPYGTSSDLQAQTVTSYDELGQVYQTQVYSVNPTNGDVSEYALTTNYYRDGDGNVIATSAPGGLWTKDTFNGAGWQVMQYETDGGGGASYAAADSITSDVVLTQTKTDYNKDGDETETITRDRFNTDSDDSTGALGTPTSGVEARVYYSGNYYDLGDRLIASVNVGTNGGSAWCMPDDVPTPSDTVLVTSYAYAADAVQTVTLTGSPTGGTFTLTFGGDTTSNIAYNASASTIQTDLVALGSIGSGNVVVTQAVDGGWEVRFMGSLAGLYQTQMTASGSGLTGGSSPSVVVSTLSLGGDAGHLVDETDPDGIDTRTYSDPLGRTVQTIQDFTNGAVTDSSNKTTDYTYNSVGQTSLTAELTGGVGETTTWIYGVTTGTGSTIDSDDVMSVTEQPNPSTGLPDSSIETTVTVNGLGQTLTSTDPNGTTHTYTYDVLGQETKDAVTTLGSGVDGSILRIETSYTTLGDQYIITSYNAASGGSVVNQVENVYNGLDQLIQQFQAVSGSVNVDTTPSVQYSYVDLLYGANNSRLVTTTYPDGYQVNDTYATGTDNNISRLTSLTDDHGTLESYLYLGLSTVVEMDHPETGVNMTYISQDETTGDAGDQYIGLDRFGRVVGQNWYDPDTTSSVADLQYGYDADGNVLYRSDLVNTAMSELYSYDNLGQITSFERGTLNEGDTAISGTPSVDETWAYNPVGDRTSNTVGETTTTETANLQNEITSVSGATTPIYDANGNMTTDQTGLIYSYNAWNEVVKVENSGETTLETYSYNGLGQRVTNTVGATTTSFYYSTTGQILEEQVSGKDVTRYVWSPVYVNEMIFRDTDTSGTGLTATGTSYTRLWAVQDANHNVVALLNSSGAVIELYAYDPFGAVTVMNADYTVLDASSYAWVYLFQGGRLDTITGDNHFGARDENSGLGVWTSMDPKGFAAGDDVLSDMEENEPTDLSDPSGLEPLGLPGGSSSALTQLVGLPTDGVNVGDSTLGASINNTGWTGTAGGVVVADTNGDLTLNGGGFNGALHGNNGTANGYGVNATFNNHGGTLNGYGLNGSVSVYGHTVTNVTLNVDSVSLYYQTGIWGVSAYGFGFGIGPSHWHQTGFWWSNGIIKIQYNYNNGRNHWDGWHIDVRIWKY